MYISRRSATVRNSLVSVVNGAVTLVILLIAPIGLADFSRYVEKPRNT